MCNVLNSFQYHKVNGHFSQKADKAKVPGDDTALSWALQSVPLAMGMHGHFFSVADCTLHAAPKTLLMAPLACGAQKYGCL